MHLFDPFGKLKNYSSTTEIMQEFFDVRKGFYEKRKDFILKKLDKEVEKLKNKTRFCDMVLKNKLPIFNRPKTLIVEDLRKLNFVPETSEESTGYDYLLETPLLSLTQERIHKLFTEEQNKSSELTKLTSLPPVHIWKSELLDLQKDVHRYFDKIIF